MRHSGITAVWAGKSGTPYVFHVYPLNEECPSEAGIYIFCKGTPNGVNINLQELYIGMAKSFQKRFYDHHKMDCAIRNGATHLCLMYVPNEDVRVKVEKDLLDAYPTKCNEVNNPVTPK